MSFSEIIDFWSTAGWFVIPLLVLSIASWLWLVSLFFKLKESSFRTCKYENEITQRILNNESRDSIRQWLFTQQGIVPRIIRYIFQSSRIDEEQIKRRYEEASSSELNSINKEFGLLSSMIKAAPLLGLLGTVVGMVDTFAGLGAVSSGIEGMAAGISKALLTTQLGLVVALPGIFGIEYLKRKFNLLSIELERLQFHINALCDTEEIS